MTAPENTPFTPTEIAAFRSDTLGVWQPSMLDQLRLLATVEACYREIETANKTAREFATRSARLAARLSVIADMAREGMDEFNDWSKPAVAEPGGAE